MGKAVIEGLADDIAHHPPTVVGMGVAEDADGEGTSKRIVVCCLVYPR